MPDRPVVVVGDAVTDVLVSRVEAIASGSDTPADITVRPGGSAANVAAWLAHLDVPARFVGRVGADPFGEALRDDLRSRGVATHLAVDQDHPTGVIVVLVAPSGERDMLTDRGANRALAPGDLSEAALDGAAHLHLSGYVLLDEASQAAGEAIIRAARDAGLTASVGAGSRRPLEVAGGSRFLAWTAGVELCMANQDEAATLTGERDPADAVRSLAATYREAVVTSGSAGAWWCGGAEAVHVPAQEATAVVDSTGAGDAFTAGFLHRWLAGSPPQQALEAAAALSAVAVGHRGGRPPQ